jgi:hypothetical protein
MSDDTAPAAAAPRAYAWQDEEPPEEELRGSRSVVAVAVLAGLAVAIASTAAVVVLVSPTPLPDNFTIRPVPVEQAPLPQAAPSPAPKPVEAPPAARLQVPPEANQRFSGSLAQGGMWQNDPADGQQAMALCRDLANGDSPREYIAGTMRKSPQLTRQEATQVVLAAIDAYCPQYDR